MKLKITAPGWMQAVDPRIVQNICSVAALPKSKIIDVGRGAVLEHRNQFVLRAVEAPLSAIGFVPDQDVFEFRVARVSRVERHPHIPPVHEQEVYCPIPAEFDYQSDEGVQEVGEGGVGHFARGHSKFTLTNFSAPHR